MFVTYKMQKNVHVQFVGTFMVCPCTTCHSLSSIGSLVIAVKCKVKCRCFTFYKKLPQPEFYIFLKINITQHFRMLH